MKLSRNLESFQYLSSRHDISVPVLRQAGNLLTRSSWSLKFTIFLYLFWAQLLVLTSSDRHQVITDLKMEMSNEIKHKLWNKESQLIPSLISTASPSSLPPPASSPPHAITPGSLSRVLPPPPSRLLASRQSGTNTGNRKTLQTIWNVYRQSGKFPDSLETYQTIWKHYRQSGNFPDNIETFQTIWKFSRHYGNFPDNLVTCQKIWKLSRPSILSRL